MSFQHPGFKRKISPLSSGILGSNTLTRVAGGALSGQRVVSANSVGEVEYTNITSLLSVQGILGITETAVSLGANVSVITSGYIREPTWSWTTNLPIFLLGTGLMTQTVPTTGYVIQLGVPVSSIEMLVDIKMVLNLN
jgi:hypothetical protein